MGCVMVGPAAMSSDCVLQLAAPAAAINAVANKKPGLVIT
jgi:hypothetical protein